MKERKLLYQADEKPPTRTRRRHRNPVRGPRNGEPHPQPRAHLPGVVCGKGRNPTLRQHPAQRRAFVHSSLDRARKSSPPEPTRLCRSLPSLSRARRW